MTTPFAYPRSTVSGVQPSSFGSPANQASNSSNTSTQTSYSGSGTIFELVEWLRAPESHQENVERTLQGMPVLDLSQQDIGENGLERLCNALKLNQSITALILDGTKSTRQMNWKGMHLLAELLGVNTTIKTLSLQNNRINDITAASLMTGLIKRKSLALEQLNLSHNQIQSQTMECLSEFLAVNTTLTHLLLDHNRVDQEGIQGLVDALSQAQSSLSKISLGHNRLSRQDQDILFETVARSNDQISVDCQYLGIAAPRILTLTFGSPFDFLSLWRIRTHNAEEKSLLHKAMTGILLNNAEHAKLVNLCIQLPPQDYTQILQCTPAVDRSHQEIDKPSLKKLFELLKANKSLTTLTLRNITPPINAEDVPIIIDLIRSHPSMTSLDLGQNEIGSEGAIRIIQALQPDGHTGRQSPIQTLCLEQNKISQWTRHDIYQAVCKGSNLTCLDLRNNIITAYVHPDSTPDRLIYYEPMENELKLARQGRNENAEAWKAFKSHSNLTILTRIDPDKEIGGIHMPPRTGRSSTNVNDRLWHEFRVFGIIPLGPLSGRRSLDSMVHVARCTLEEGQSARLPWLIKEARIKSWAFENLKISETQEFTQYFARETISPQSLKILERLALSFTPETWKSVGTMEAFLKALPARDTHPLKVDVLVSKECEVLYPRFRELLNTAGCNVVLTHL
ncbi:hypothetical protein [Hydrogenophaga sp.]|uniref:hypothetical protein n=1 Tax=Hydrogenophaga sp. TaxID=1904254 RepID=UPI00271C9DC8|nr:hypothetical protein [Hydrogenophaga sp.]MDO9438975.1 hypothetical protein [Hydrogenophaga sp.]